MFENFDLEPELWYNRVDAFHGGLGVEWDAGPLTLGGGGGWSSGLEGDDRWSYHSEARLEFGGRNEVFLEGRYEDRTASRYDTDLYNRFLNSVFVLFGGDDYYDYYRSEGFTVSGGLQIDRLETTLSVGYRDEEHTSLAQTTNYDFLGQSTPLRANPAINTGDLRAVTASLVIGDDFNPIGVTGRRRLALTVEHSTPGGLNSDFDYTRYGLVFDWRQETFHRRRLLPNTLDLRLVVGTSSGDLPLQRLHIADASLGIYRPFGANPDRTAGSLRQYQRRRQRQRQRPGFAPERPATGVREF